MPASTRTIGIGVVFLLVAGTLAVGLAFKAPCATGDWNDGRPFTRGCYTDLVGLLQSEQLTGDRLPYLDPCQGVAEDSTCDEYPVLTMWTMRFTAWASGPSTTRFFFANAILMWIAAFWIALCLFMMVGRRVLYFALAPTLALAATNNWDLLAVALTTGATLAYVRRRDVWSGVLLGLGAAAKLYPALLVVPFVAGRFRGKEADRGIHLAWAAAGTWVALNLPFALWGTTGWLEFFQNSRSRSASWNSLWNAACKLATGEGCANTSLINVASLVLFVAWVVVVWLVKARRDPGFPRWTLGFPILVIFLLSNKVYSPQFSLWLLPWFALALPEPSAVHRVRGRGRRRVPDRVRLARSPERRERRAHRDPHRGLRARRDRAGGDPRPLRGRMDPPARTAARPRTTVPIEDEARAPVPA